MGMLPVLAMTYVDRVLSFLNCFFPVELGYTESWGYLWYHFIFFS